MCVCFVDGDFSTWVTVSDASDAEEGGVSNSEAGRGDNIGDEVSGSRPCLHTVRFSEDDRVFGEDLIHSSSVGEGEELVTTGVFVKGEPVDEETAPATSSTVHPVFDAEFRRQEYWRPRRLAFLMRTYESFSHSIHVLQSMTHGARRELERWEAAIREREGQVGTVESFQRVERCLRQWEEELRAREAVLVSRQAEFERTALERVGGQLDEIFSWHRRVEEELVLSSEVDGTEGDDDEEGDIPSGDDG